MRSGADRAAGIERRSSPSPIKSRFSRRRGLYSRCIQHSFWRTAVAGEKQAIVTVKHLADTLADKHGQSKKDMKSVMDDLVTLLTKNLKSGAKIRIPGFGVFQVRKRPARMGRNPATGEAIKIKASKKVAFRAAKELKESV
ncbi:MAG: HU family DNA-binding protein [Proteobacteria bacterium]|nr:HU family DNA-binding protein [Pseudomonadota bacterium]MBI3499061.1 HU family DNA-binding protein [Pseudomonadota bacterium]